MSKEGGDLNSPSRRGAELMGLWFVGFLHLVPASYLLSSHSKVSSPLFKQRFLSISLSPSLCLSPFTLSLSLYIHSSPRREREEKLNSQTPTRCRRNAKPWRAAEPRSPPRTPEPALGPARSKVGRRRPAGGRAAGSPPRGRAGLAGPLQPTHTGVAWALRPGCSYRRAQSCGAAPTAATPNLSGGTEWGKGVREGGRGEWHVCQAVQAPFPTAVCHWHGHSHSASLICSLCKSVCCALLAGAADEL